MRFMVWWHPAHGLAVCPNWMHGPRFSDGGPVARDSVLLQLSHAAFQQLYRDNETAQQAFIRFICQNLRTTLAMLVEDHASTPRQHVAQILLSIFTRPAAPGDETGRASRRRRWPRWPACRGERSARCCAS